MNALDFTRRNLNMQGFRGLDDRTCEQIDLPLRLAPALCMAWAALGTALASPAVLLGLVPFALVGVLRGAHPFDALYDRIVRPRTGGPRLPVYGRPRRFACALATAMLISAAALFATGHVFAARCVGWSLVAAAFVNVSLGFCVPSFLWHTVASRVTRRRVGASDDSVRTSP